MVTTLLNRPAAREIGYQVSQYICKRVQANPAGTAVVVSIGVVPKDAIIIGIHNRVATAFNGTTPVLTVGSNVGTPVSSNYNNLNATMAEVLGSEALLPLSTFALPLAADTEIFAALTGTAVTAGEAYVAIQFIKPLS